jgi:hypothetical protein
MKVIVNVLLSETGLVLHILEANVCISSPPWNSIVFSSFWPKKISVQTDIHRVTRGAKNWIFHRNTLYVKQNINLVCHTLWINLWISSTSWKWCSSSLFWLIHFCKPTDIHRVMKKAKFSGFKDSRIPGYVGLHRNKVGSSCRTCCNLHPESWNPVYFDSLITLRISVGLKKWISQTNDGVAYCNAEEIYKCIHNMWRARFGFFLR